MDTQSLQRIVSTVKSRRESRPSNASRLPTISIGRRNRVQRGSLEVWERANESGAVAKDLLWPTAASSWRSLNGGNLSARMT
jgi:hypothetical protein